MGGRRRSHSSGRKSRSSSESRLVTISLGKKTNKTSDRSDFTVLLLWLTVAYGVFSTSSRSPTLNKYSALDTIDRINKDIRMMNQMNMMNADDSVKNFHPMTGRPMGLRWRDDASMVMPVLTERSASPFGGRRSQSSQRPTTSNFNYGLRGENPTLEDLDLIDVLWRSDIAAEKGNRQLAPNEQFEQDLQTLTVKSTCVSLTEQERTRYEDLSKAFFEDFYSSRVSDKMGMTMELKRDTRTPTDKDLADLLEDVTKEESQLNQIDVLLEPNQQALINNVSLSQGMVYTQTNLTELAELREQREQYQPSVTEAPQEFTTLFNTTDPEVRQYLDGADLTIDQVYPPANFTMTNDTETVVSTGNVNYDHCYGGQNQQIASPSEFDQYFSTRTSFSNTSGSSENSRTSSVSPRYTSDSDASMVSRIYGKLVPEDKDSDDMSDNGAVVPSRNPNNRFKNNRNFAHIPMVNSAGQKKRGRQSKDEQLVLSYNLPATAQQIAEMSLPELQNLLKDESLVEYQKQLIRKIRRRGKNKVAARTCRQRRGDKHDDVRFVSYGH